MAEAYTHGHHASVTRSHARRGIDDSAAYLLPHLRDDMALLDVSCGPGSITIDIAERFPGARVVGIDASSGVIAEAAAAARDRGVKNVEFHVGDAYASGYEDGTFDVVHAHQVLQHLARPVDALREMRRVATVGGIVAARDVDYEGITWYPPSEELAQWLELYLRIAAGWTRFAGERDGWFQLPHGEVIARA